MNNTKSELQGELGKIIEKLEEFRGEEPRKWHELNRLGRENLTGLTDTPLHRQTCTRSTITTRPGLSGRGKIWSSEKEIRKRN